MRTIKRKALRKDFDKTHQSDRISQLDAKWGETSGNPLASGSLHAPGEGLPFCQIQHSA